MARDSKQGSGGGVRATHVRVKTARKRSTSSTRWLARQLNDPYVRQAKAEGYRSRAAYKLIELNERYGFLKPGMRVVDLGAAPGGWCQVALNLGGKSATVVAIDLLAMPAIPGVLFMEHDFLSDDAPGKLIDALQGHKADLVLSDMAPNASGTPSLDHLRIVVLAEAAFLFACDILKEGGSFVCKVWQGGAEHALLAQIKQRFREVKHAKPKASRADSAETYLVATGFRSAAS